MCFKRMFAVACAVLAALMLFAACSKTPSETPGTTLAAETEEAETERLDESEFESLFESVPFLIPEFDSIDTISDAGIISALKGYYSSCESYYYDGTQEEDGKTYALVSPSAAEAMLEYVFGEIELPKPTKAENNEFWLEDGQYHVLLDDPGSLMYKYDSTAVNADGTACIVLKKTAGDNEVDQINLVMVMDSNDSYRLSRVYYGAAETAAAASVTAAADTAE